MPPPPPSPPLFCGHRHFALTWRQAPDSIYEPDARHWLKMKKDYLQGMADSVDLVVLGGYYGTGNKVRASWLLGDSCLV